MIVASSDFVYTSRSLFWPDVIILAAVDLDLTQSVSMAIGVQHWTSFLGSAFRQVPLRKKDREKT